MLQRLALRYVCMEYTICCTYAQSVGIGIILVTLCVLILYSCMCYYYVSLQPRLQYISSRAC